MTSLPHIYIVTVVISFLCSLISFRLHYPFHLILFSVFLGVTALTEIIANFFLTPFHLESNFPVYNLFILVEYPLLAFYFKQILRTVRIRKLINLFLIFYPLFWASIFLFVYTLNQWNTYCVMAGDLFIIVFAVRYLYELFTSDSLISFRRHSEFWIAVALILYSCCELPIMGILNFLETDQDTTRKLLTILQVLNIIMYLIFIYAFICRVKLTERK
jgi:hypothetical protein